jgi:DNA-binding beta-propeller fold protein YncE
MTEEVISDFEDGDTDPFPSDQGSVQSGDAAVGDNYFRSGGRFYGTRTFSIDEELLFFWRAYGNNRGIFQTENKSSGNIRHQFNQPAGTYTVEDQPASNTLFTAEPNRWYRFVIDVFNDAVEITDTETNSVVYSGGLTAKSGTTPDQIFMKNALGDGTIQHDYDYIAVDGARPGPPPLTGLVVDGDYSENKDGDIGQSYKQGRL